MNDDSTLSISTPSKNSRRRLTTGSSVCACGAPKQCWAGQCWNCTIAARKPPFDSQTYIIEDVLCRRIALTKNRYTLIWEVDYEFVTQFIWHAGWSASEQDYYAARRGRADEELRTVMLARVLMNPLEGEEVDHWNHITLDNRRSNLRTASTHENSWNRKRRINNTSGQSGVHWHTVAGKWFVYIGVKGVNVNLGYYSDYEEACQTRKDAEIKYFGVHRFEKSLIDEALRRRIESLLIYQPTITA